MRTLGLLLFLLACVGCGRDSILVVPNRLAKGGGGVGTDDRPTLDVVVRMESDATDFSPDDLMRVEVDGIDRAEDVILGGLYGVLRLDPGAGSTTFIELARRTSPVIDTFTWDKLPYTGPTIAGVAPDTARVETQVVISGAGFSGGSVRVFFGGEEGTVDASSDSSITATVPLDAEPGLVWVLIDGEAAEGIVGFQPLDAMDVPIELPVSITLFAAFPAHGDVETAVQIYGTAFDKFTRPFFNGKSSSRLFGIETVDVPPIGEILTGFAVPIPQVPLGAGELLLDRSTVQSNDLPFTIDG